jgi:hypothetical protein
VHGTSFWRNPVTQELDFVLEMEHSDEAVHVDRLTLAAWLRLNGQELVERRLQGDGKIVYLFKRSADTSRLITQWEEKAPREVALARFSRIVSFEIKKAVHMRRSAGLPTRLRSFEKS